RVEGRAQLRARAEQLRAERAIAQLGSQGCSLDGSIDLRTQAGRGRDYEVGTIAHKLYARDMVPADEDLEVDLERVLQAYDAYLKKALVTTPARDMTDDLLRTSATAAGTPQAPVIAKPAPPQPRVFVSHSHQDNAFCRAFVDDLRAHGLDIWYDEQGISAGA